MSTVILDTITGKSTATTITIGSTPVVSASANSMTIRGEGSAQTSIQQGLAKGWVKFDQANTTIDDSHNVSSVTDSATGQFNQNHSNNMANANYSTNVTSGYYRVYGTNREDQSGTGTPDITSVAYFDVRYLSSGTTFTGIDMSSNTTVIHGDLA